VVVVVGIQCKKIEKLVLTNKTIHYGIWNE